MHSQAARQPRTFFEVPCRNLPLTNPNPCNAFLCKHKSALHLPFWPFGPKRQGWEKMYAANVLKMYSVCFKNVLKLYPLLFEYARAQKSRASYLYYLVKLEFGICSHPCLFGPKGQKGRCNADLCLHKKALQGLGFVRGKFL